jgi:hypothetical protein
MDSKTGIEVSRGEFREFDLEEYLDRFLYDRKETERRLVVTPDFIKHCVAVLKDEYVEERIKDKLVVIANDSIKEGVAGVSWKVTPPDSEPDRDAYEDFISSKHKTLNGYGVIEFQNLTLERFTDNKGITADGPVAVFRERLSDKLVMLPVTLIPPVYVLAPVIKFETKIVRYDGV